MGSRDVTASVMLVDDHAVIAVALSLALEASGFGPVIVAPSDDLRPTTVIAMAEARRPDIVLLDLHLGSGQLGLPMIRGLVALGADVVLFTASQNPRLISQSLRAGAAALIDKSTSFEHLVGALAELAAGRPLLTEDERSALLGHLESQFADEEARLQPFRTLTPREAEVLRHLVEGSSPKEIARAEGISVSTVRGHIDRILTKLGVSSQREALSMARSAGWPVQIGSEGPVTTILPIGE